MCSGKSCNLLLQDYIAIKSHSQKTVEETMIIKFVMMYFEQDSIGQHQNRLNSIIDTGKSSAMEPLLTQLLTVIKI